MYYYFHYLQSFLALLPLYVWAMIGCAALLVGYVCSMFFFCKKIFLWIEAAIACLFCGICFFYPVGLRECLSACLAILFIACFFAPLLLFKKKVRNKPFKPLKKGKLAAAVPVVPVTEKVLPQPIAPATETSNLKDVDLSHAFFVLDKLKEKKLNGRDKMESDIIRNMLVVYSHKESLTVEESRDLNNYLATLLKMMAAYAV